MTLIPICGDPADYTNEGKGKGWRSYFKWTHTQKKLASLKHTLHKEPTSPNQNHISSTKEIKSHTGGQRGKNHHVSTWWEMRKNSRTPEMSLEYLF